MASPRRAARQGEGHLERGRGVCPGRRRAHPGFAEPEADGGQGEQVENKKSKLGGLEQC